MDFESLVGSSAYLAKQLELRWFYHWKPEGEDCPPTRQSADADADGAAPSSSSLSSSSKAEATNANANGDYHGVSVKATRSSVRSNRRNNSDEASSSEFGSNRGGGGVHTSASGGGLVRKSIHSMPFLRRNIIVIGKKKNKNNGNNKKGGDRGYSRRRRMKSNHCIEEVLQGVGVKVIDTALERSKSELKSEQVVKVVRTRLNNDKRMHHHHQDDDVEKITNANTDISNANVNSNSNKRATVKVKREEKILPIDNYSINNKSKTSSNANATIQLSSSSLSSSSSARARQSTTQCDEEDFQSYIQSPSVHWKILEKIPSELHHDEEFVLERLRESWLEKTMKKRKNATSTSKTGSGSSSSKAMLRKENNNGGSMMPEKKKMKVEAVADLNSNNTNGATTSQASKNHHPSSKNKLLFKRGNVLLVKSDSNISSSSSSSSTTTQADKASSGIKSNRRRGKNVTTANTNATSSSCCTILPSDIVFPPFQRARAGAGPQQKTLTPAYFHYVYMQPDTNIPATFVEELEGRKCPLCGFDGGNNEGLLRHCGMYHGTLLDTTNNNDVNDHNGLVGIMGAGNDSGDGDETDGAYFEAALGEEGQFHVIVRGVPMRSSNVSMPMNDHPIQDDFEFVHPRFRAPSITVPKSESTTNHDHHHQYHQEEVVKIPFLQRQHHKAAFLDAPTRSKKLLALQAADAPAPIISAYLPGSFVPIRQYFHARTNLPMAHGAWEEDSDGEPDEAWLREMSSELLDEFEDVSDKEKVFMKLWNSYIKSHCVIADRDLPGRCREFIVRHGRELVEGGLRLNLLLHLFNLWDSGVISSNRILACMSMFDGVGNNDIDIDGVGGIVAN